MILKIEIKNTGLLPLIVSGGLFGIVIIVDSIVNSDYQVLTLGITIFLAAYFLNKNRKKKYEIEILDQSIEFSKNIICKQKQKIFADELLKISRISEKFQSITSIGEVENRLNMIEFQTKTQIFRMDDIFNSDLDYELREFCKRNKIQFELIGDIRNYYRIN